MAKGKVIQRVFELKDKFSSGLKKIEKGTLEYKKSVNELKKTGISAFKGIAGAIAATSAGMTALGTIAIRSGTQSASSLEGYRLTLETVLKDTKKAGDLMKWASQFANITPFETDEVVKGTVRLSAYGIEAKKTMGLIGDMAAVMNTDLMQGIEAVADAQTGELERLKEFGITKAMIEKKAGEMYRGQVVVNNKGQIEDQEKFNTALFALMEDRFKGGMERQATTLKGIMSTLKGTWKTGLAEMVGVTSEGVVRQGSLFELLKTGVSSVSQEITNLASNGITFDQFIAPAREWVESGGISRLVQGMKDFALGVWNVFQAGVTTYQYIRNNWPLISPIIYGIVGAFTAYHVITKALIAKKMIMIAYTKLMTIEQWSLNAAMAANPIGVVVAGIALLIAAGVFLIKNWDDVKLAGKKTWNGIVGVVEWGVNSYVSYVNFMIENALTGINFLIDKMNTIPGVEIGSVEFGGFSKMDFGSAKFDTEGQEFNIGKKRTKEDSFEDILAQFDKEQEVRIQSQQASNDHLIDSLDGNTKMLKDTKGGGNTISITVNGSDLTAEEIADKLIPRLERKLFA